jgi:lipoprotein-anchoring transpeptidase ErfK/SrfK
MRVRVGLTAALLAVGLGACSQSAKPRATSTGGSDLAAAGTAATNASGSSSTAATGVAKAQPKATSSTAKPKPAPPPGLGPGAKGPDVQAMEAKLDAMHYSVGKVDGVYDTLTSQAVIAFQKVQGLPRTGRATPDVLAAVNAASQPAPMLPDGGPNRVEIDLKRQVLFLYQNGVLVRTLMVSTGGGYRYCVDGSCDRAITPGGSFRIGVKILGKHTSKLGVLYNPLFFNGGIAIHGEPAVPTYPASHGCVRIPMSDSRWFYDTVTKGTAVYVLGGAKAPVPFNEPAPGEAPPNSTATTTAPPATTATTTASSTTSTTAAPTTTAPSTTSTTAPATTSTTAP